MDWKRLLSRHRNVLLVIAVGGCGDVDQGEPEQPSSDAAGPSPAQGEGGGVAVPGDEYFSWRSRRLSLPLTVAATSASGHRCLWPAGVPLHEWLGR